MASPLQALVGRGVYKHRLPFGHLAPLAMGVLTRSMTFNPDMPDLDTFSFLITNVLKTGWLTVTL